MPISQAGTDAQVGFTLVELLVAMAILILAISLIPVAYNQFVPGAQLNKVTQDLLGDIKHLRSAAQSEGVVRELWLDDIDQRYSVDFGRSWYSVPDGINLSMDTERHVGQANYEALRFFENGSAYNGRITLKSNGSEKTILVDWLTGRAVVEYGR